MKCAFNRYSIQDWTRETTLPQLDEKVIRVVSNGTSYSVFSRIVFRTSSSLSVELFYHSKSPRRWI